MAKQPERILLSWSGGKESVMVLKELLQEKDHQVCGLVATVCTDDGRVTGHGIDEGVLSLQAAALGLPLEIVYVPKVCQPQIYSEHLCKALEAYQRDGITKVAFGDLFLDDIRDFREECLEAIGMEAVFPLWQRCTKELSWSFINAKFKAVVTCVDPSCLSEEFAGRPYDRALLADLPLEVDPCGENGEFHTFVYEGPLFNHPVAIKLGERYTEPNLNGCNILVRGRPLISRKVANVLSAKSR